MLVHNVFFSLQSGLSADQIAAFRTGLESLKRIQHAEAVYIGTPANVPDRPVLEKGYDFCLTVLLRDIAAHDAYQADPLHQEFIGSCKQFWSQVKVYDAA